MSSLSPANANASQHTCAVAPAIGCPSPSTTMPLSIASPATGYESDGSAAPATAFHVRCSPRRDRDRRRASRRPFRRRSCRRVPRRCGAARCQPTGGHRRVRANRRRPAWRRVVPGRVHSWQHGAMRAVAPTCARLQAAPAKTAGEPARNVIEKRYGLDADSTSWGLPGVRGPGRARRTPIGVHRPRPRAALRYFLRSTTMQSPTPEGSSGSSGRSIEATRSSAGTRLRRSGIRRGQPVWSV